MEDIQTTHLSKMRVPTLTLGLRVGNDDVDTRQELASLILITEYVQVPQVDCVKSEAYAFLDCFCPKNSGFEAIFATFTFLD